MMINISYDPLADAATIWVEVPSKGLKHLQTYICEDLPEIVQGEVNLDFNDEGTLHSIEILQASKVLPKALLISGT